MSGTRLMEFEDRVVAGLMSVVKRAVKEQNHKICSSHLLGVFLRQSTLARSLESLNVTSPPSGGEREVASDVGQIRHEAVAILREVLYGEPLFRKSGSGFTRWSPAVPVILDKALRRAEMRGSRVAGQEDLLVTLLSDTGSLSARLLDASGVDRGDLLRQVNSAGQPLTAWASAVVSLELFGVLSMPWYLRLIGAPLHIMFRRGGPGQMMSSLLSEEAERQAIRQGAGRVHFDHVVAAIAAIGHQLAIRAIDNSAPIWSSGTILRERFGVTYDHLATMADRGISQTLSGDVVVDYERDPNRRNFAQWDQDANAAIDCLERTVNANGSDRVFIDELVAANPAAWARAIQRYS